MGAGLVEAAVGVVGADAAAAATVTMRVRISATKTSMGAQVG